MLLLPLKNQLLHAKKERRLVLLCLMKHFHELRRFMIPEEALKKICMCSAETEKLIT